MRSARTILEKLKILSFSSFDIQTASSTFIYFRNIVFFCVFLLLICLLVISHFRKISFLPSPRYLLIQGQHPNQTFLASVFLDLSQTFQEYQLLLHFAMKMWLS